MPGPSARLGPGADGQLERSSSLWLAEGWIITCTALTLGGWLLSELGYLNRVGYAVFLVFLVLAFAFRWRFAHFRPFWRWLSIRRPFPLLFLLLLGCELAGGLLYPPTNYDGLTYRVPRILHWLAANRWHWIGGWNTRMDYSGLGYEWLSAPLLAITGSDRLLFLPNIISFALLPGLIFSAFRGMGISGRVARFWMWVLPCGYSFVLQAGSIGNDSLATVFLLSALVFARSAAASGKVTDLGYALLSIGLLTGIKASNLPLVLPCLISIFPALRAIHWNRGSILCTAVALLLATAVSFLPLAVINKRQTGDWTGDPLNESGMKLRNSVSGLIGNTLQLAAQNIQPPLVVGTERLNLLAQSFQRTAGMQQVIHDFPRLTLRFNELAGEEAAGVGLGILILGTVFWCGLLRNLREFNSLWSRKQFGLLIGLGGLLSFAALLARLGSEAVPRIATPYYPLLLIVPSLFSFARRLVRQKTWLIFSLVAALSIFPTVLLSPARPLFPVEKVLSTLDRAGLKGAKVERVKTVYAVYQQRSDPLAAVREKLPPGEREIGFAGTADESEISFWRPFDQRTVRDLPPQAPNRLPNVTGLGALVTSDWGCQDRYGRTPEALGQALGWQVSESATIQSRAGGAPMRWTLLLRPAGSSASPLRFSK